MRLLDEAAVVRMVGEGAATLVARAFAAAGLPVPPDALARFLDVYAGHLLDHTRAYEGVPEALEALSRMATLAVLTNKPRAHTDAVLRGLDLAPYFSQVLGGDGPQPRKPDPAGLGLLMASFRVPAASTLLVGDSVVDVRTARAASVPLALARYGFGFADIPPGELTGREHIVRAPRDVVVLVEGGRF